MYKIWNILELCINYKRYVTKIIFKTNMLLFFISSSFQCNSLNFKRLEFKRMPINNCWTNLRFCFKRNVGTENLFYGIIWVTNLSWQIWYVSWRDWRNETDKILTKNVKIRTLIIDKRINYTILVIIL